VFLTSLRAQASLDKSVVVGGLLVATTLPERATRRDGFLQAQAAARVLGDGVPVTVEATIAGASYLAHYMPLRRPDGQIIGAVEALLPLAPVRAVQQEATVALLISTALAALAATGLGWLLARRFSGPIRQLARDAETIGQDLTRPVAVRGPMETQLLSQAIERMRLQLYETHSALQREKVRYANILESLGDAVITFDSNERVTSLNKSAAAMLGIDRAAAIGLPLDHAVLIQPETSLTLGHIPPSGALPLAIRTQDGRSLTVAATRSQIQARRDGMSSEQILVLRDISEEEAVRRLKEDFLANITHEFRTPLSALIASLEILREDSEALTLVERQHMLAAIYLGVQRLDTLVQNLLDSASLQAGYFRVDLDVTQLEPLIDEAVEIMRPLAQQRGQTIRVAVPELVPPIIADDRRVVQVLINLLSNASKFGPREDTLQITVEVDAEDVRVAVTDHGPGIPASRQARLFDRFLRPGAETVRAQGVGLGLSIVKAIVEQHGGRVAVSPNDQQGTTFTFTLLRATDTAAVQLQGAQPGHAVAPQSRQPIGTGGEELE
jgi:PAS domain S-box-containing protein